MSPAAENVVARPRGDRTVLGLALMAAGLLWFFGQLGVLHVAGRTLAAAALVAIGVGLIATHRTGRRIWPILLGGFLTIGLLGHSAGTAINSRFGSSVGAQNFSPKTLKDLQSRYQVAAGAVHLDVTNVPFPPGSSNKVEIDVGTGAINITVPRGLALEVDAQDSVGAVNVFNHHLGAGFGVDQDYRTPDWASDTVAHLRLVLHVGAGAVNVVNPAPPGAPTPPTGPKSAA